MSRPEAKHITVAFPKSSGSASPENKPQEGSNHPCIKANLELFHSGSHADCTVKCGESYVFRVHTAIICVRNKYFQAAFTGRFEEGDSKTVIWDDKPYAVECLLYYLYTLQFPGMSSVKLTEQPCNTWEFAIELFKIADKRECHTLQAHYLQQLLRMLKEPAARTWQYNLKAFVRSIPYLWEIPNKSGDELRSAAQDFIVAKKKALLELQDFQDLLTEDPLFAVEFYKAVAAAMEKKFENIKANMEKKERDLQRNIWDYNQNRKPGEPPIEFKRHRL
ncbi:MAG: hypothetical protein Q9227_002084 [Pyrenula ochraceoflavens]